MPYHEVTTSYRNTAITQPIHPQISIDQQVIRDECRGEQEENEKNKDRQKRVMLAQQGATPPAQPHINVIPSLHSSVTPARANTGGTWDDRFEQLLALKEEIVHCRIPCQQKEAAVRQQHRDYVYLHNRDDVDDLHNHRSAFELREQPEAQVSAHEDVKKNQEKWDDRFQQLLAYKKKFGHCKVSSKEKEYKSLRNWLGKQREAYKIYKTSGKGGLNAEQIGRLDLIGVSLEPYSTSWNARFQELKLFERQHGHCRIPQQGNSMFKRLGQWLARQKKHLRPSEEMRQGILSFTAQDLERARLLESMGVQL